MSRRSSAHSEGSVGAKKCPLCGAATVENPDGSFECSEHGIVK